MLNQLWPDYYILLKDVIEYLPSTVIDTLQSEKHYIETVDYIKLQDSDK